MSEPSVEWAVERLRQMVREATTGPWKVAPNFSRAVIDARGNYVGTAEKVQRGQTDARLIALAPQLAELVAEMGEALAYIEWIHDGSDEPGPEHNVCPACGLTEKRGHDSSCPTAPALAKLAEMIET